MSYIVVVKFSEILKTQQESFILKRGCVVDTSILFAASYPLHNFNSASEEFFEYASELEIPLYTNVNVRSEFINSQRQIMIPEGLSDLYTTFGNSR